jgi:hypothetical protein
VRGGKEGREQGERERDRRKEDDGRALFYAVISSVCVLSVGPVFVVITSHNLDNFLFPM